MELLCLFISISFEATNQKNWSFTMIMMMMTIMMMTMMMMITMTMKMQWATNAAVKMARNSKCGLMDGALLGKGVDNLLRLLTMIIMMMLQR
jgi:hypothetical protein